MSQLSVLKEIEKEGATKEAQGLDWAKINAFLNSHTPAARIAYQRLREAVLAEQENPPPRIAAPAGPESFVQKRAREVHEEIEERTQIVMKSVGCSKEKALAAVLNTDHELYSRYRAATMNVKE